ncbi:MAG TPA: glutathione S-transferase N-terminal domain-containing protein [Rhabdaerophilum sp.]|nr:glutathione S-transferase N-terminal domain-containing protein [Rhabdaerophilum sp.]
MILIGQFDSPFVRRVGITMRLYDLPFEHKPWSTFGEADKIRPYNPLLRVPVLVQDDGIALVESQAILDYLDRLVPPEKALMPRKGPLRTAVQRVCALATGIGDKAVSLFYELRLHDQASDFYVARCRSQIGETLALLERERTADSARYWFGEAISQADVTIACILRFLNEAHPGLADMSACPALSQDINVLESLDVFMDISQAFIPPKG